MSKLYDTRTMLPAVENMPHVSSFLRDTFFPRTKDKTVITDKVELDYKKGKRKMAPFVAPRVGGVTVSREGFKTQELAPPRIAPQRSMTIDDINQRGMGESVYSTKTPAQRQVELLGADLKDLGEQIDRREEWMASQLLFEGKVVVKGYSDNKLENYIEQEIDYGFDNFEELSGSDLWTSPDSNPYEYLRTMRLSTLQKSGIAPNVVIFGTKAYESFMNHSKIKELFNKLNMAVGKIEPSLKSDAVTFIGYLPELNLELYLYSDWYIDEDDTEKSFVPVNKILMANSNLGGYVYGAVTQMEQGGQFVTYEGARVPKFWSNIESDSRMVRLTSRPIPLPTNVDAWFVSTVV